MIQSREKFEQLEQFLKGMGYSDIKSKLHPGMRHELLNERNKEQVYQEILAFLDETEEAI